MALPGPKPARYWRDGDFDQLRQAIADLQALATTGLVAPSLDTATAVPLTVGGTRATEVDLGRNGAPAKVYSALAAAQAELTPVVARYKMGAGTFTFPVTVQSNTVNFNTQILDTHNAVTTGSGWKFTAPIRGLYLVTSNVRVHFAAGVNGELTLFMSVNGAEAGRGSCWVGVSSTMSTFGMVVSHIVPLALNDTVNVQVYNATGAVGTYDQSGTGFGVSIDIARLPGY